MENDINILQNTSSIEPKVQTVNQNIIVQSKDQPLPVHIKINIVDIQRKGSIINQYIRYVIQGKDKLGQFCVRRRYSQFFALRECLINNWPGLYIPYIPEKILIQKNSMGIILYRERFLRNFLKKIKRMQKIHYSKQYQIFLRDKQQNVCEVYFDQLKKLKYKQNIQQIIAKYKVNFPLIQMKKNIKVEQASILQFKMQLKNMLSSLPKLKEKIKKFVQSKSQLNKKLSKFYQEFFPKYEKISISKYLLTNKEDLIFQNKNNQKLIQKGFEIKASLQQNSLWIIYDLIDYEIADYMAFMDSLNQKQRLFQQSSRIYNQISKKLTQSSQISKGDISFNSIISKIKNQQFNEKTSEEIQKLQKQQNNISELNLLISLILYQFQIEKFRQEKTKFYYKSFKQFQNHQINIIQKFMQYWKMAQNQTAQKLLKCKQWNQL